VVYEDKDLYRGQERRDVVLMNEKDMASISLIKNSPVMVKSKTGALHNILARPFDIKRGAVLMYYPEVNSLIGRTVDPLSKTPGFKSAIVAISGME
jgi:anaerobic selenocysteine-containing dehydrogenase